VSALPATGELPPLLVLTGPTGAGKTQWALEVAAQGGVEIVSADSAQVYRGLDIGTAKPSHAVRARVPHHLIDVCDPTESYSAGRFVADALQCMHEIRSRGHVPLLVGGTMLYLRALLHGLAVLPAADPALRARLDSQAAREGWPALHARLRTLDPAAAGRIAANDAQRIQRALEVCLTAGRPLSQLQRATVPPLEGHRVRFWVLCPPDRALLHAHLVRRFEAMMAAGFLEEVRALHRRGDLSARHPAMRAVGYRQLWGHLDGEYDLAEASARAVAATRQLAKRQLTWLRAEAGAEWLDPELSLVSWIEDIRGEINAELQRLRSASTAVLR
jgi:tRNA dimethylallyltransferase